MPTVYTLDRVSMLSDIHKAARHRAKAAREDMLEAIREAREDGHTLTSIGKAIGTSKQYVHLLLTKENRA